MKKNIIHHRRRAGTIMHERAASGGAAVEAVEAWRRRRHVGGSGAYRAPSGPRSIRQSRASGTHQWQIQDKLRLLIFFLSFPSFIPLFISPKKWRKLRDDSIVCRVGNWSPLDLRLDPPVACTSRQRQACNRWPCMTSLGIR